MTVEENQESGGVGAADGLSFRIIKVKRFLYEELFYRLLFVITFITLWQLSATTVVEGLLPTPVVTVEESFVILSSGVFVESMINTIRRVAVPFLAAWAASVVIGVAMGLDHRAERFFDIGVILGLTIPSLAWAVTSIMFFGLSPMAAYFAVFITILPMITINFWEGVKDIDMELTEMGEVFNFSRKRNIRHILLPQLYPYMFSAGRFGLGLAWKIVVLVEFLGMGNGVGYQIGLDFSNFNMAGVLAWTGLFTLLMLIIEYGGFKYLERRYLSWRPEVGVRDRGDV
jgi:NitT/TauT family transport system permease protein